jgi:hypothetical protein
LSYETAADALLALAVSQDGELHNGDRDDPIRRLLYVGAEACQRVDQAQADREAALLYAAELRSLLEQAVGILEAQPLPVEGGTWDGYLLAHQARELLGTDPLAAEQALREERHATRQVARAASAVAAAQQEGDPARIRLCEQALHQAVASLQEVHKSAPAGPLPGGSAGTGDSAPVAPTQVSRITSRPRARDR